MKQRWTAKCKEWKAEDTANGVSPEEIQAIYTAEGTHLKEYGFAKGKREVWCTEELVQSITKDMPYETSDTYRVVLFDKYNDAVLQTDCFTTIFDAREFASNQRKEYV